MENKSLDCPACDEKNGLFLNRDEQFKKKLSELDAKLSELMARFSGETVMGFQKCPFCAEERSAEAGTCRFCKSDLTVGKIAKEQGTDEPQERIIYIIRGNRRDAMEWHKIANTEAERKAVEKKYGRVLTMDEVIEKLTRKGWVILHRDEKTITFSGQERPFNRVLFLFLLGLFVFPALIYVVVTRSPKTVNVTFPLK